MGLRRLPAAAVCVVALLPALHAQTGAPTLPVRRVVLYKNGVGYFEHVGRVRGTQALAIDFNSEQLNDVLQSLTAVDLGGGRIGNISFNSEAPLQQRVAAMAVAVGPGTTRDALIGALRGTRVEVRSGDRVVVGRLLSLEQRARGKDGAVRDELTLVTGASEIRTVELTPAVGVRLLDRDVADEIGTSLGLLATTLSQDRRRMSIAAEGSGDRDVLVSYISAVPVWKTTYRLVLPDDERGRPHLQGWAIVDNTIGEDWSNVELSLVAGAPQSFVQPLSQPLYVQRPVVAVSHAGTQRPQLHAPTMEEAAAAKVGAPVHVGGSVDAATTRAATGRIVAGAASPPPPAANSARDAADMQPAAEGQALGDLFEYRIGGPVTIRKNESALVPILNADVDVVRVSLWNDRVGGTRPLRSLWLTNASRLTLDGGSFTVLDGAAFAGEGLIDGIKPGEKRLLSYAVDLGVQVESRNGDESRHVGHVRVNRGEIVQRTEQRTRRVYSIRNSDESGRVVVIEHPIRAGWALAGDLKPTETSAGAYRFAVSVEPKSTASLVVEERHPVETRVVLDAATDEQIAVLIRDTHEDPSLAGALAPIRAQRAALARLQSEVDRGDREFAAISSDQARLRENLRALKDGPGERDLTRRYVSQLNQQEDRLSVLSRERSAAAERVVAAKADLARLVEALSLDVDVQKRD